MDSGGWYDRSSGEFVAKTEKGKLKFYNKRQKVGAQDPAQSDKEKNLSSPNTEAPPEGQQQQAQQQAQPTSQEETPTTPYDNMSPDLASGLQSGPPPVPKTRGTLTIGFGRFNPPHAGHGKLMDVAASAVQDEGDDYIIVPSRSNDKKKNPLDADSKVSTMRSLFPDHAEKIINDPQNRTIF